MNTNINFPQAPFLDNLTQRPSLPWLLWLQSPSVVSLNMAIALGVTSGGTGLSAIPTNGQLLIGNGTGYSLNTLTAGTAIEITNGSGSITVTNTGVTSLIAGSGISVSSPTGDVTVTNIGVLSFKTSLNGLTPSVATTGAVTLAGTLGISSGGTGQITATAAFNALSPITSTGDLILGNGTNSATRLAIGTNAYVLTSNGTTASWQPTSYAGAVTSFQTSISGLTPSTATTGGVTLAGTVGVSSGGTGAATLTGYVKGSGTSALTASATIPTTDLSGTISNAQLANSTISGVSLGGSLFNLTAGTGVSFSAGTTYNGSAAITISATGSGGSVTSVAATVPSFLSITGSPITTSGTLAITLSGTALPAINGGTAQTTYATGDLLYASATNTLSKLTVGTTGYTLTVAGGIPTWKPPYVRTSFTATAGQTSFSATYNVGYVQVFLNGVLLNGADYTASSGTAVVLAVAANLNDIVELIASNV